MNWLPIIIVSVQVTLVAAVGLLAGTLLRSAAHRHSVLLAALLCILGSPLFYVGVAWSGLSVKLPVFVPATGEIALATATPTDSTPVQQQGSLPALPETALAFPQTTSRDAPTPPIEARVSNATTVVAQHDKVNGFQWRADFVVAGLWLVGTLFSLLGVLRSQLKTEFILKAARPIGQGIDASVIAETERRLNAVGHLRIATTGKVAGPAVVGVLRPWILIPARYLETLSRNELLQILIHEGAHAIRRDPLVALLQRIGGALFWWHPLVLLINRDLIRTREEVCDNFVLNHTEPGIYGATLLRLATLSPAMARVPLAIGMFDGRGKLEDRIRGLLDSKRKILTHVPFVTGAAVLGTFALFSVVVAAARVGAQNPADAPPIVPAVSVKKLEAAPAEAVDAKEFSLILTYHGEADKPFYNLILLVPPQGALQANPFSLAQRISEGQAGKLIKHLKESKFFEHAKITKTQNDPTTGPQYLLRVRLGESHYEETLGWDIGTLLRLDGMRESLDGEAAKSMDQLLVRLDGQRKVWEAGEIVDDLKTTLTAEPKTFRAGQPIPIKLELTNVGEQDRRYRHHQFIRSGSEIVVTDEHGRQVPYLGGGAGLKQSSAMIEPGETKVIEACDLSDFYYLRRPGLYTVAFRPVAAFATRVPASNVVRFQVAAGQGAAADGDPMGRLLSLVRANFGIVGSPNAAGKMRPGRNRQETPGRQFIFVGSGGLKGSNAAVWLWLTDEAAKDAEPSVNDYLPTSDYLGKVSRWHVYLHAPPEALKLWPALKEDLKTALEKSSEVASLAKLPAKPNWSATKNGLRTRITAEKQTFPAGSSIPLKLEIENVGTLLWKYETPVAPHNNTLVVIDEAGRPVPYLAGLSQVQVRLKELAPGAREEMKAFDLSESFYLRRPGRYSVCLPGGLVLRGDAESPIERAKIPDTAPFEFDVTPHPDAAADGDPIGRLLPLVKEKWWLTGTGRTVAGRPGGNREEVPGYALYFHYVPTGYKVDSGSVSLWLTEKPAAEQPVKFEWPPASEYLGKVDRWHVYTHSDAIGGKAWPTLKEDIQKALSVDPKHAAARRALKDPQWGAKQEGLRARLSAEKQTFDVGESISIKVEIENASDAVKDYEFPKSSPDQSLKVIDERGRAVPVLHSTYQTVGRAAEQLDSGKILALKSIDLSTWYYLRRPGRYTAQWTDKPASAGFEFDVVPNPTFVAVDGDPVGRLLPLVKEGWALDAWHSKLKLKPGSNWGETTGQTARFVRNPPLHKGEGLINLYLADEPAAAMPVAINSSIPTSEYLGKVDRWHLYYLASGPALAAWPTAKQDIKKALAGEPSMLLKVDTDRDSFEREP